MVDVDGVNVGDHIRRMLSMCISDRAALKFTFYGYGPSAKRPKAKAVLGMRRIIKCIFGKSCIMSSYIITNFVFLAIDASRKWSATSKEKELKVCDWLKHTKDRIAAKQLEDNNREAELECAVTQRCHDTGSNKSVVL